jgi:hypothetical protein
MLIPRVCHLAGRTLTYFRHEMWANRTYLFSVSTELYGAVAKTMYTVATVLRSRSAHSAERGI